MSKGISPLIGAPLLILITIVVAMMVGGWLTMFSKEETESIKNRTEEKLSCQYAQLYIRNVTYDCNNSCLEGNPHNLTVQVKNSGSVSILVNELHIETTKGQHFNFSLNETKTLSVGDIVDLKNVSFINCSSINNSIENVRVISINCPSTAHDKFPGEDVTYLNC